MSLSNHKQAPSLQALWLAAAALPGLAPTVAQASSREEDVILALRGSQYAEAAVPQNQAANAETERFDIQVLQARFAAPLGRSFALAASFGYETLSGASPWFVQPDENGRPIQVLSGPTIDDQRSDASLRGSWHGKSNSVAASAGFSTEDDYQAVSGGLEWQTELDEYNSLNFGAGFSSDQLKPTDGGSSRFPTRPVDEQKRSLSAVVGYSTVLNPRSQMQLAVSYTQLSGFLSDPYKLASVQDTVVQDARPDSRWQLAATARYRYRITAADASLHADLRYFLDEWEVNAFSLGLAWHQDLGDYFTLIPSLRYHTQSQAYFYQPFYRSARADGLASSDYRLSPYGAYTLGLSLRASYSDVTLSLGAERYESEARIAAGQVRVENPGLVDFMLFSAGIEYRF